MTIKSSWTVTRSGKKLTEDLAATLECPHCQHKFEFKLAGHKTDPLITCPNPACNKEIQIESGGSLQKTAAELENLDRSWENLFK
jgi:hypothetical protein